MTNAQTLASAASGTGYTEGPAKHSPALTFPELADVVVHEPGGASTAVDEALARGHRATAVFVPLVVLGEAL